ncbi:hypothetical protein [Rhodoligotrophos defluvii]|uniref:hypothetical protein n=1 Tax=Rhodoligotrophos defluvii TaxID=2561934 RepID=UPI0010CA0BCD|nr:hypothetical protein [Rhodoligotrophos defluvii]
MLAGISTPSISLHTYGGPDGLVRSPSLASLYDNLPDLRTGSWHFSPNEPMWRGLSHDAVSLGRSGSPYGSEGYATLSQASSGTSTPDPAGRVSGSLGSDPMLDGTRRGGQPTEWIHALLEQNSDLRPPPPEPAFESYSLRTSDALAQSLVRFQFMIDNELAKLKTLAGMPLPDADRMLVADQLGARAEWLVEGLGGFLPAHPPKGIPTAEAIDARRLWLLHRLDDVVFGAANGDGTAMDGLIHQFKTDLNHYVSETPRYPVEPDPIPFIDDDEPRPHVTAPEQDRLL